MVHFFQATQPGLHSWCKNSWPLPFLKTQRNGPGEPFCFGPKELEESKVSPLSLEKALLLEWNPLCFGDPHRFFIFFQHGPVELSQQRNPGPHYASTLHPAITADQRGIWVFPYRCQMSRACKIYIQAHHSRGNSHKNLHIPVRWCPGW